jgi:AcrR family transcriptional regulator
MSDTRVKMLEATVEVLAESGIRGLRLEEVAKRIDVAVSLIYYHFGNRIDLLRETFQYLNEQSPSTILAGPEASDAFERLQSGMVNEFTRPGARSYAVAWSELTSYAVFEPRLRVDIDAVTGLWVTAVQSVIVDGQADGSIRRDIVAEDEAQILTSLLDGLLFRWIARSISVERGTALIRMALRQHLTVATRTASKSHGQAGKRVGAKSTRGRAA